MMYKFGSVPVCTVQSKEKSNPDEDNLCNGDFQLRVSIKKWNVASRETVLVDSIPKWLVESRIRR